MFNHTLDDLLVSLQELQDNIDETAKNYTLARDLTRNTTCLGCAELGDKMNSMVNEIASLSQQAVRLHLLHLNSF